MLKNLSILLIINSASALRGAKQQQNSSSSSSSITSRNLAEESFKGDCTVSSFAGAVGGKANLASLLGVGEDDTQLQEELDVRCKEALNPTIDLSDTTTKGPQFLKNFLDGGTTWNDNYESASGAYNLAADAAIIPEVYAQSATSSVFAKPNGGAEDEYPGYFSNFYIAGKECRLGAMTCCYTGNRLPDTDFIGNAEMCALDMTYARQSNHINRAAFTYYDSASANEAFCTGFAYEEGSFGEAVKYNTLFHMAMMTNLYGDGYVKNIPGAPLCGCAEQMPIVSNAKCTKAIEGYTIDSTTGEISVNISWEDCGSDLATYYDTFASRDPIEKEFMHSRIVGTDAGQCEAAAKSFMNDRMYVPTSSR